MAAPKPLIEDELADLVVSPIPGVTVTNDDEFRAAVRAGIASYKAGPTYDLETIEAELYRITQASP